MSYSVHRVRRREEEEACLSCDHRTVVANNSCGLKTHIEARQRKCERQDNLLSNGEGEEREESYIVAKGRDTQYVFKNVFC